MMMTLLVMIPSRLYLVMATVALLLLLPLTAVARVELLLLMTMMMMTMTSSELPVAVVVVAVLAAVQQVAAARAVTVVAAFGSQRSVPRPAVHWRGWRGIFCGYLQWFGLDARRRRGLRLCCQRSCRVRWQRLKLPVRWRWRRERMHGGGERRQAREALLERWRWAGRCR